MFIMKKILSFLSVLCAIFSFAANYYWVGGSGNWTDINHWRTTSGGTALPSVIPGPTDNVFFDVNSGFTVTSKTITLDNIANCHNITFAGSPIAPALKQNSTNQILNIYGSSEWQAGMGTIEVNTIIYIHTGEAKTIKSNGVKMGISYGIPQTSTVIFEEESSISLLDDIHIVHNLNQKAGTWNTNNNNVTIGAGFEAFNNYNNKTITLNLGSSNIYLLSYTSSFKAISSYTKVNAGTSHIHFMTSATGYSGMFANLGHIFYDVTFEGPLGVLSGNAQFNRVEFKNNGNIGGNNTIKDLIFTAGKTYTLQNSRTQTIENLTLGGTPCDVTFIQSNLSGTRANIKITGSTTEFNFGNLKDINASGKLLHFGEQSTIANQNNNNITYDPYNPGAFSGFGADWIDHTINNADPSTYILSTDGFYGNLYTTYKWYKVNDSRYDPNTVISTAKNIDIRSYGMGTYRVEVNYNNTCIIKEDFLVTPLKTIKAYVNPNLRMRVK